MFHQIKVQHKGDYEATRHWFEEWKDKLPEETWISHIAEHFDTFKVFF